MQKIKNIAKGIGAMLVVALSYVLTIILCVGVPAAVIGVVVKWVLNG